MRILTLDFETYDPNLLKYGMGWCFKKHYPECEFDILGCGLIDHEDNNLYLDFTDNYEDAKDQLIRLINSHDEILMHNSAYDLGCLYYLLEDYSAIIKDKLVIDTLLLAKHDDQSRLSYSLSSLTEVYKCIEIKQSDILHDYAWLSGMYQKDHLKRTKRNCYTRPSYEVMNKWCMSDMRRFPSTILSEYCLQDVRATKSLYIVLDPLTSYLDRNRDSDILKVCIKCKYSGVRIDLNKCKELSSKFKEISRESENIVRKLLNVPETFNVNSNKQLGEALISHGFDIPHTESGNTSLRSTWLEEQSHEIFLHIRRHRKALKVEKDFIQKLINYQKIIPEFYREEGIGWLYPSLKPYGATTTGRFTSGGGQGCLEISIHQIPSRDEEFGAPIREIFLPHKDEKMICCDFSAQEPRLQVHYATKLGCSKAGEIAKAYQDNPALDYHQKVADMTKIIRAYAKTINLGLSYGMGIAKLCIELGLEYRAGKVLIAQYHRLLPFMQQLQTLTSKNLLKLGYIKTLGGRKLKLNSYVWEGKYITNEKDALSKLIQGSAADQCIEAMILADRCGLKILYSVHDEIIISSKDSVKDLEILKDCMENCYNLIVPMYVEGGVGDNWREAK
jgi:DNA polymerase I-like protein with 3'-5' exonuclease and polymerase domains